MICFLDKVVGKVDKVSVLRLKLNLSDCRWNYNAGLNSNIDFNVTLCINTWLNKDPSGSLCLSFATGSVTLSDL